MTHLKILILLLYLKVHLKELYGKLGELRNIEKRK